jgi:hypothetical protein
MYYKNNHPVIPTQGENVHKSIDIITERDSILCTGVESAPLFKKYNQQCYSFNDVPPVRRYPNDYLMDTITTAIQNIINSDY